MSVKHSTHRRPLAPAAEQQRVGGTYGERRQWAQTAQQSAQPIENNGLLQRMQQLKGQLKEFFSVTPKIDPSAFPSNTQFLNGENVGPQTYRNLTQSGRNKPVANDAGLFADLDQIVAQFNGKVPGDKKGA